MNFNVRESKILKDLFHASNGLDLYTFWRRYKITPSELYKFAQKFKEIDLVELKDEKLFLTKKGSEYLVANRFDWISKSEKLWRKVPEEFRDSQLPINKPIAPRVSLMDKSLIPKSWRR